MARNYLVLDTETVGLDQPLVYDIGWVVSDSKGAILCERRYLIREVYENTSLMTQAYYYNKMPEYHADVQNNRVKVVPLQAARLALFADMLAYNIREVYAYNADFDHRALNATVSRRSGGFVPEFLPDGISWRCIMGYTQDTVCTTPKYVTWAVQTGNCSEKGNPKGSAEAVYRYITRNGEFIEAHTALEDAKIETAILHYARAHHGRKRGEWVSGSRWRKMREVRNKLGI